ncbi:MAG: AAA family ATPase [Parcubacteria group bacterium]|jgi:hypothetical protein
MAKFMFRPAVRENVSLLIGMAGGTGSGKTYSAMRLAKGICGKQPFAVIDTEAGRAKHYADVFRFDHGDLRAPFRPKAYLEAIEAADAAGYPVIVVDSASHEHAGDGGLLDWHEDELDRMAGNDWTKRERCAMSAWIKPKMEHKQFVQRLLQVRAHLILCFRAEQKVEMGKDSDGRTVVRPKESAVGLNGWIPICEKNLPYEMTVSFLLMADHPGIGLPIKLQQQHRAMFDLTKPIGEECGERIAAWASGGLKTGRVEMARLVREAGSLDELREIHRNQLPVARKEGWENELLSTLAGKRLDLESPAAPPEEGAERTDGAERTEPAGGAGGAAVAQAAEPPAEPEKPKRGRRRAAEPEKEGGAEPPAAAAAPPAAPTPAPLPPPVERVLGDGGDPVAPDARPTCYYCGKDASKGDKHPLPDGKGTLAYRCPPCKIIYELANPPKGTAPLQEPAQDERSTGEPCSHPGCQAAGCTVKCVDCSHVFCKAHLHLLPTGDAVCDECDS